MAKHVILGGKVNLYQRENSPKWQCSTYLAGKNHRASTKTDSLSQAKDFAEDWYLTLRGKLRDGELVFENTFADAAKLFQDEYEILTDGERNERWVQDHYRRIRMYLNPYFGKMGLSKINAGTVQEYRVSRIKRDDGKKPPSRSTLHHETVTLRLVLKSAVRKGWITCLTSGFLGPMAA